jgi:hypothetical protein
MTSTGDIDPRTVDADGFVIGTHDRVPGMFGGGRPSVGGLGATVARGDRVGMIVGLGTAPEVSRGLTLAVVWLSVSRSQGGPTEGDREAAWLAYESGGTEADWIPAEGLIALDAWMPESS